MVLHNIKHLRSLAFLGLAPLALLAHANPISRRCCAITLPVQRDVSAITITSEPIFHFGWQASWEWNNGSNITRKRLPNDVCRHVMTARCQSVNQQSLGNERTSFRAANISAVRPARPSRYAISRRVLGEINPDVLPFTSPFSLAIPSRNALSRGEYLHCYDPPTYCYYIIYMGEQDESGPIY